MSYTFITPNGHYELNVEERDTHETYSVTTTGGDGYDEWYSDYDLRGAIGVSIMRVIRHETGDNCMCRTCREPQS